MTENLSLEAARKLIIASLPPLTEELLPLAEGLDRRPSRSLRARFPVPHFPQSTMDGFAVRSRDILGMAVPGSLPVTTEVAAGRTRIPRLGSNQAIRIMTGGAVPSQADQVLPQEWCDEENGEVTFRRSGKPGGHIREVGVDLKKGQVIIGKGERITPYHLHLLATSGHDRLPVFARPRIGHLCTGSELVEKSPLPGQIISGNRYLLAGLIRQCGGMPLDLGLVGDDTEKIADGLENRGEADALITTGGMGPGKYDLMEEVLDRLGARILYRSLAVRPGRATMFGIKGRTLYFCLPGPPPAAAILFHELIRPAILAWQGKGGEPQKARAILAEDIVIRKRGIRNLRSGVLEYRSGRVIVRPARLTEPVTALILVPAHRRHLKAGEKVSVHLLANG